jgi:FAD/FMN-containing dehydrogenase
MGYNTWRNEKTEINHNVRAAAFETLKNLGEAQTIIEYAHFKKDRTLGDPVQGWGRMILIHDLAQVLPAPGPADAERLWQAWRDNVEGLGSRDEAMIKIADEIQLLRLTTLETLASLR